MAAKEHWQRWKAAKVVPFVRKGAEPKRPPEPKPPRQSRVEGVTLAPCSADDVRGPAGRGF